MSLIESVQKHISSLCITQGISTYQHLKYGTALPEHVPMSVIHAANTIVLKHKQGVVLRQNESDFLHKFLMIRL